MSGLSEDKKRVLRGYMIQTKFDTVMESLQNTSVEELKQQSQQALQLS